MTSPPRSRRRGRSALSAQMLRLSAEGRERIEQHWVARVLALLADDALLATAAATANPAEGMKLECGIADKVWDHTEVQARIRQLAERGVEVELTEHVSEFAERTFSRPKILVRLAR